MSTTSIIYNQVNAFKNFGIFDKRGREVGASVVTKEVKVYDEHDFQAGGCWLESGYYFVLGVGASRANCRFNSAWTTSAYATCDERDAALDKYLSGAYKRAKKNFPWSPDA